MINSTMTRIGSAIAISGALATPIAAATIEAFPQPVKFDNGYSMLGDQAPENAWTINPVRNDQTGAVMCVASYKLDNTTAVVTDTEETILSADAVDDLNMNARYVMHFPTEENNNQTLIRTGFPYTEVILNGANVRPSTGIANDAVFVDSVPTEITSTSRSAHNNPHFVPHTFADQVPAMPAQAFEDCNAQAAAGDFDNEFARYEAANPTIASFDTGSIEQGTLTTNYMRTFVPASSQIEAEVTRDGRIESFESCDLVSYDADGYNGQQLRFSKSLEDVFGATVNGCTRQTKPICVNTSTAGGELKVTECIDFGIEETPYYSGSAIAVANAGAVATGGNVYNGGGSSFTGGAVFGGISIGGSSTGDTIITGDTNIFEDGSINIEGDYTDITNIINEGDTYTFEETNICSNNTINAGDNSNNVICGDINIHTGIIDDVVPIGEGFEQALVDGAAAIDSKLGTNFHDVVYAVLDHKAVNLDGTFMLQTTGVLALLGAGGAFSRRRKTASEGLKAPAIA